MGEMESRTVFISIVSFLLIGQSCALFFGTPDSQCNSNNQCPTFRRTRCLGNSFIFCFGKSESYIVSGRCLNRSNFFCDIFLMVVEDPETVATVSVLNVLRIQTVQVLISIVLVGPVL